MSDVVDDIKIEVQLPPEEGDNLLTNTSGQYGAWQWGIGPLSSDFTITGDPEARTIQLKRGGTSDVTEAVTDWVPVTPGRYANARLDIVSLTAGHTVTLLMAFNDTPDPDALGDGPADLPTSALGTHAFSSVLVPAGKPYMRLILRLENPSAVFDLPDANSQLTLTKAMIAEVATAGIPTETVTNLMRNGGFEYSTTGWSASTNIASTLTRDTWIPGGQHLKATVANNVSLGNGEYCYVEGPVMTGIEEGERYSLEFITPIPILFPPDGHGFRAGIMYRWYDSSDTRIGANHYAYTPTDENEGWAIITAPAGATRMRAFGFLRHYGPTISSGTHGDWYFLLTDVSVVKSNVRVPYFDGDTPDTSSNVYAWTGTAGNSTATRASVGAVPYVETDEQFLDITGGYNQFSIDRDELDISTMNGVIVDPALSPAKTDSVVTPGRGIRVSAYRPETDAFERLFTGTLGACTVEYDPLEDEKRQKVKINITSTGNESALAQASRSGVALVADDLPDVVLQQAGIPWVVDGFTGITPASSVADNESSTALDQVALTRDTVAGIAWVDPYGTLRFETTPSTKSTGPNTMGPADYSAAGLKVGFSTDNLINQVLVTRLIRASDGSTEERQAGQTYEDGASVRKWGAHSYPLTIASLPNDIEDAEIAAQRILDGNATPTLVIEELAINSADVRAHAFHDLFDLVTATADTIDGAIVADLRIARIKHEFTTERRPGGQGRWRTTYGFKVEGVVASPAIQPPLGSSADGAWLPFPFAGGFHQAAGSSDVCQYRVVGNIVCIRGHIERTSGDWAANTSYTVGNMPAGYRPTATSGTANTMTALCGYSPAVAGRMYVRSAGDVVLHPATGSPGAGYLNLDLMYFND